MEYDFAGWATKNDLLCGDGRVIKQNAFSENDGLTVPLVWNHDHTNQQAVLGHALLENKPEGVYAYGVFNETEQGQHAKELVKNGDIACLSIYANQLKHKGNEVVHGCIRELSLVLAGANPGAYIDFVMAHAGDSEDRDSMYCSYDEALDELSHAAKEDEEPKEEETMKDEEKKPEAAEEKKEEKEEKEEKAAEEKKDEKTIGEIIETLNEEQLNAVYALIGMMASENGEANKDDNKEIKHSDMEDTDMKTNTFAQENAEQALAHSEFEKAVIADAKRYGSMSESFRQHADELAHSSNLPFSTDVGNLFPDAHALNQQPIMVEEDDSWVGRFMSGTKHVPYSRVRSLYGQMSGDDAKARGYVKGNMKLEAVITNMKRSTTPTTVYIKMKMDRDDVLDITDFDVVAWQKAEMRKELNREIAIAALIGDGRAASSDDKINESNIRPVLTDDDFFTIKYTITAGTDYSSSAANDSAAKGVIRGAQKARKDYKGSGNCTFYTTEDVLTDLLLIEDADGRVIYDTVDKLCAAMRVRNIEIVPEMSRLSSTLYGIILNPADYTFGADKGGDVNMFDDFDIDYNQMKYLMETRCSGALTVPYCAIALKKSA